jgi:hypothetical protein
MLLVNIELGLVWRLVFMQLFFCAINSAAHHHHPLLLHRHQYPALSQGGGRWNRQVTGMGKGGFYNPDF